MPESPAFCCHYTNTCIKMYFPAPCLEMWPSTRRSRIIMAASVTTIFCALAMFLYNGNTEPRLRRPVDCSKDWSPYYRRKTGRLEKPDVPRILLWHLPYGHFASGLSENVTRQRLSCPEECILSYDRTTLGLSDAVVFHVADIRLNDMPECRAVGQKWVFWTGEAPPYIKPLLHLKDMFNWTMTYRSESDIPNAYGAVTEHKTNQSYDHEKAWQTWRHKSKMAGWAVSHCKTASRREEYVEELRKYATVDVYGECGTKKCPRKISSECYQLFAKKYFFYLSFENSICREYVTEKLFNVLRYDIIPVVLGGANYTAIAPPDSFIDALTFRSPKHLAEHLRSVAGDFELHRKYLRWKTNHAVLGSTYGLSLCRLCKKLHSPSFRQTTIIRDVFYWFSNMSNCRSWNFTH